MDLRDEARMNYATGRWNRANLLVSRGLYDPLRTLQLELASSYCSLVLLKGRRMHRDFGRGREHVKYFLDSAYSTEHLIPADAFASKLQELREPRAPLRLVYFGRLTASKGVDRCIEAVARARRITSAPLSLTIIGAGEDEAALRRLASQLCVDDAVAFHAAVPFGPELFRALYPMHLLLAAPMIEDTPRSALDALACGVPILAFDTEYYADLKASGAVDAVRWPSVESMAQRIVHFAAKKEELIPLAELALEFARTNTQEDWLASRVRWTLAAVGAAQGNDAEAMSWRRVEST
jgi:glycosyltransferase involved in cell wall biosynthesis